MRPREPHGRNIDRLAKERRGALPAARSSVSVSLAGAAYKVHMLARGVSVSEAWVTQGIPADEKTPTHADGATADCSSDGLFISKCNYLFYGVRKRRRSERRERNEKAAAVHGDGV